VFERIQTFSKQFIDSLLDRSKSEYRDAARLALQSSVSAALMYFALTLLGMPEKFVGVLTAVLIVEPSLGSTISRGKTRLIATLVGCVVGVLCMYVLPYGYGTIAALALSMLVMNAVAGLWPDWRYGVVGAVALSLGSEQDAMATAIDRTLSIGLGFGIGALVSLTLWPDKSEDRAMRTLDAAVKDLAEYTSLLFDELIEEDSDQTGRAKRRYQQQIERARSLAGDINFAEDDPVHRRIRVIEKLYNAAILLGPVSDRLFEGRDEQGPLNEKLRDVQQRVQESFDAMAQREQPGREQIDSLKEVSKRLYEQMREMNDVDKQARCVLAFVVDQIVDSIAEVD
jgi:uncharacterized membrane protein YccC